MQIDRTITDVTSLGPGNRLVIWVNGCKRNCKGCVSKALQENRIENEFDIEEYFELFNFERIDGVTISGGEPFEQIDELLKLVNYLNTKKINDILVYTGYTYQELINAKHSKILNVLDKIAVLIDGPYVEELNDDKHNLKGSSNQNIIYLKKQYQSKYEAYIKEEREMSEYVIENIYLAIGIPTKEYVKKFNGEE